MKTTDNQNKPNLRKNSGRKPLADKKILLRLYILQSIVDKCGGVEPARTKATQFLNNNQ